MTRITGNCELDLNDYCKDCTRFVPWVSKEEYDDNDEYGYNIVRKEYRIVCRHGKVCRMWNS